MSKEERRALARASRRLYGPLRPSPAEMLREAAAWCEAHGVEWDAYGSGEVITAFEARVAELLGYPAARFVPSGTLAQLVAMRVWCDRAGMHTFGMHPTSHLELHEERAYAHLHGLQAHLIGPRDRPMLAQHLEAVQEPLGAVLTELPIREAGGQLPTWSELEALKAAAKDRGVPLHVDGARLWGCAAAYDRPLHEVTAGFDSCYVSFYKDVGALSGAMLLGPTALIDDAKRWQRRHGGNLHSLLPNVVTAAMRLDATLEAMPARLAHTRALVAALAGIPGVRAYPDPPHTPMFHVVIDLEGEPAYEARDRVAREHGIWLFGGLFDGQATGTSRMEVSVQGAAMALEPSEVRRAMMALVGGPQASSAR